MKEAPERIWLLWADGRIENRYQASATDHTEEVGCREFIRLDAHEAAVAAARAEALSEVAGDLRYRASEPGRTGPSIRALVAAAMAIESLAREEASK